MVADNDRLDEAPALGSGVGREAEEPVTRVQERRVGQPRGHA
jgi:hypothetical protein